MSTTTDRTIPPQVDTGHPDVVRAVLFHPDGNHLLGGGDNGIRQWRISDGKEVEKQTRMQLRAICISRDHRWVVSGAYEGATVWDQEMRREVLALEGTNWVGAVDTSPDSTRLATGNGDNEANIWSIPSGKRLIGPLKHDNWVNGIKFSPNGDRIATAHYKGPIRIFDSHNGDELINIKTTIPNWSGATPLAWSSDGRKIFFASHGNYVSCFDLSARSNVAESPILHDQDNAIGSIALATNGKFIATFSKHSRLILFLDASTLARIGSAIEDSEGLESIALSVDDNYLATGRRNGKIVIRDLGRILPESYGPFHGSTHGEGQQGEQPLSADNNESPGSNPEDGGKSSLPQSTRVDGDDLLEVDVSSSTPAPQFDYDEFPSPVSSDHSQGDEIRPSDALSPSSDAEPMTPIPEARAKENVDTVESSRGRSILKKWLQRKTNRDPVSRKPDRNFQKSRQPDDRRSRSPPKADARNEGHSGVAAGQRQRRAVAKPVVKQQHKLPRKTNSPNQPTKYPPPGRQRAVNPRAVGHAQQPDDPSEPSAAGIHVTQGSKYSTVAVTLPTWMLCFRSGTHDETH